MPTASSSSPTPRLNLHPQNQHRQQQVKLKLKRLKCRGSTISSADAGCSSDTRKADNQVPASESIDAWGGSVVVRDNELASPARVPMGLEYAYSLVNGNTDSVYSGFSKFNSALTAGLLNPLSPPPSTVEKTRSSPTLFEIMASEPDVPPKSHFYSSSGVKVNSSVHRSSLLSSPQDEQALMVQRISDILAAPSSAGNQFNDPSSDIKLRLSSKDGISVSMNVHCQILIANSRFFSVKLSDRWSNSNQPGSPSLPYMVEIADCDDIKTYIGTLRLRYCKDLRRMLTKEDVPRVLGILKVSAAIGFEAGVLSCLEYLEAVPWAEDKEEKVASLLSELRLEGGAAGEVLKRVSVEVPSCNQEGNNENEEVKLLNIVLEGKDEKAMGEMKGLVMKILRENLSHNDLSKESLYLACEGCMQQLRHHFLKAAAGIFRR